MSKVFNPTSDEESALGQKDGHDDVRSIISGGHKSGIDDGVGEVNRALKHRHLQMIGIGGGLC